MPAPTSPSPTTRPDQQHGLLLHAHRQRLGRDRGRISPAATATPEAVPGAPTGVSATPANSSTTVSWTAPTGTFSPQLPLAYSVFYNGGSGYVLYQSGLSNSPETVSGLVNGTSYTFEVTATDAYGQTSAYSTPTAATTPMGTPATPSNVSANESSGNVNVTWTAASSTTARPGRRLPRVTVQDANREHRWSPPGALPPRRRATTSTRWPLTTPWPPAPPLCPPDHGGGGARHPGRPVSDAKQCSGGPV